MIGAIHSALSGLLAYAKQVDVTAHNVAHVNINEFKKSRTEFVARETGGVRSVIQKNETAVL